jgi:hypothetical protein
MVGAVFVVFAPPAAAGGDVVVTVNKVVMGTPPSGATFTVDYDCTTGVSGSLDFDESGAPVGSNSFGDDITMTCTLSESATGGADNVAFTCDSATAEVVCGPGGDSFVYTPASAMTVGVTITVTNAYANVFDALTIDPAAGAAVPGQQITVSGTRCTKDLFGGSIGTGGTVEVTVSFTPPVIVSTTAAGTSGDWSVQFTVPADANGSYTISAICGDPVPYAPLTLAVAGTAAAPTAVVAAPTSTG